MGVATGLGSFPFFAASWVSMMAAMMLPSYIAIWAIVGIAVYAFYRPYETVAAGVAVITAGVYELAPSKRHFRVQCRDDAGSGLVFGLDCVDYQPPGICQ
jgi:predicted metal-binding membrane protein